MHVRTVPGALAVALVIAMPATAGDPSEQAEIPMPTEVEELPEPTVESVRFVCEEIRRWVRGVHLEPSGFEVIENKHGQIRRYDWNDPTKLVRTFTRKELCKILVRQYNKALEEDGAGACKVKVRHCLAALEKPSTYTDEDFRVWMGLHKDTNRDQDHPDDAYWFEPVWWPQTECWRQDVVWYGENPRRGWHCADNHGLWGWDPKITGHAERGPGVIPLDSDGQNGWKGAHAGYPFDCADGCTKYIIWILPKEAYLESIDSNGRRVAVGLWHGYSWDVDPKADPPKYPR